MRFDFTPFGDEWKKAALKMPKKLLIEHLKNAQQRRIRLRKALKNLYEYTKNDTKITELNKATKEVIESEVWNDSGRTD